MSGNVWEWVQDLWNDNYAGAPANGRAWLTGDAGRRVLRGGSWNDDAQIARSANRIRFVAVSRYGFCGFRVALSPARTNLKLNPALKESANERLSKLKLNPALKESADAAKAGRNERLSKLEANARKKQLAELELLVANEIALKARLKGFFPW
jgi:hypothetical protein